MDDAPRILTLHVRDCPLVDRLVVEVEACLCEVSPDLRVELAAGDCPSPTLLVGGVDVVTGAPVSGEPRCRLDLPSRKQARAAMLAVR